MRPLIAALALAIFTQGVVSQDKPAPKIEGLWAGTLKVGPIDLRLAIKLTKKDAGYTGTMDSIDQGAKGIPIDVIEFKDDRSVRLVLKSIGGVYEGKLAEDGKEITGTWKQGGDLALVWRRTDKAAELVRPQHPKAPFPYEAHEVTIQNEAAKIKLAGTLTVPRGKGPFPAVVLLTGSGPQDRDETIFGHKPFLVLADYLTKKGIAVLRADDRGVGGSTGSVMNATLDDNVADALVCVKFLKDRPEIDGKRLGLIGHSEGGYVAPLAANKSKDVAFIVLLAGPGLSGEEILYLQGSVIVKSVGGNHDAVKKQRLIQELLFTAIKEEPDNAKVLKLIREHLKKIQADAPPLEQIGWAMAQKQLEGQLKAITTPWFRFFLTYDPQPVLKKVSVPVLAVIGEKDVQVPPKENLDALKQALKDHPDVTLQELAGLNHLFQSAKTGALSEYGQIEETFAPSALELIAGWIQKRTGRRE